MRALLILIILKSLCAGCTTENGIENEFHFTPKNSAILDPVVGKKVINQYSRDDIEDVEGFWIVNDKDVQVLEKNFKEITTFKVDYDNLRPLEFYAFQYVGVIIKGKRYIYVNAFPEPIASADDPYRKDWRKEPIRIHDGGNGFWGALFDLEKQKFSRLSINGGA